MKKRKKEEKFQVQGFCFRCEHRARSLEGKGEPRCECGMHKMQVCGCYMFKPCLPVVTQVAPGYEKRPRFAPVMLCARERGVELFDGQLTAIQIDKKKAVLLWAQKKKRKEGRK